MRQGRKGEALPKLWSLVHFNIDCGILAKHGLMWAAEANRYGEISREGLPGCRSTQTKAKPITEGIAYTQLSPTFPTKCQISLLSPVPEAVTLAELNGRLISEASSQEESLFVCWSRILLWPHDLIDSFPKALVPAQSFGCFFQLFNVFSFCMWEDEGLGLFHWNKNGTER